MVHRGSPLLTAVPLSKTPKTVALNLRGSVQTAWGALRDTAVACAPQTHISADGGALGSAAPRRRLSTTQETAKGPKTPKHRETRVEKAISEKLVCKTHLPMCSVKQRKSPVEGRAEYPTEQQTKPQPGQARTAPRRSQNQRGQPRDPLPAAVIKGLNRMHTPSTSRSMTVRPPVGTSCLSCSPSCRDKGTVRRLPQGGTRQSPHLPSPTQPQAWRLPGAKPPESFDSL